MTLKELFPDLYLQLCTKDDGLKSSSKVKVEWKCSKGHVWEAAPYVRAHKRTGCPYCTRQKALKGVNDLSVEHPELFNQLCDKELALLPGSHKKVEWKCSKGHIWEAEVKSRVRGNGCPYCSGRIPIRGESDIESTRPDMYELLLDQGKILAPYSHKSVTWRCKSGHQWDAPPYRLAEGKGCPMCAEKNYRSKSEIQLYDYIKTLDVRAEHNVRGIVKDRELDIYLPDRNLAIEYNGLYWHQESKVGKNYHKEKYEICREEGIELLQIWEDQWASNKTLVKEFIRAKLQKRIVIGARKTTAKAVNLSVANKFLRKHHIQGQCKVGRAAGLFDSSDLLVAVVVIRSNQDTIYLDRYASSVTVMGGLDKLLAFCGPGNYVTFADHCISSGDLYEKTGWTVDKVINPDYKYIVNGIREHKFNYRLEDFKKRTDLEYVEGYTERELAQLNKLNRIYDAGKTRYYKVV